MPLWKRSELSSAVLDLLTKGLDCEKKSLNALLHKKSKHKLSGCGATLQKSINDKIESRLKQIENLEVLNQELAKRDFIASEVPADGNCAIWSLVSLQNDSPVVADQDVSFRKACEDLRANIAQKWADVSSDVLWQTVFKDLVAGWDTNETTSSVKKEVKTESKTPKKKRKPSCPDEIVDLITPPKKKDFKVTKVGQQASAFPAKPPLPAPVPRGPPTSEMQAEKQPAEETNSRRKLKRALEEELHEAQNSFTQKKSSKKQNIENANAVPEENPQQRRRRRLRTCKKKVKDDTEKQMNAVKIYLASKGVTWSSSQTYHARFPIHSSPRCKDFVLLQTCLLQGKEPSCLTCAAMLRHHEVDLQTLSEVLSKSIDPECSSPAVAKMVGLHLEDSPVKNNSPKPAPVPLEPPDAATQDIDMSDMSNWAIVPYTGQPADQPDESTVDGMSLNLDSTSSTVNEEGQDQQDRDPFEKVKAKRYLKLLPFNSHDRRIPIRCTLCRSANQPEGKVFEGHEAKYKIISHFVDQHCRGQGHLAAVGRMTGTGKWPGPADADAPIADANTDEKEATPMTACTGQSLTHGDDRSSLFREEFLHWARHTKLVKVFGKHTYKFDLGEGELVVYHESCERVCKRPASGLAVCTPCSDVKLAQSALKSAIRFCLKYWAAKILEARLLCSDAHIQVLLEDFRKTALYKTQKDKAEELVTMSERDLQAWVRRSWTKVRRCDCSEPFLGNCDCNLSISFYDYL